MLRRLVSAVVVMGICIGIALAGEFRAVITKVEGNKVTFTPFKGKEKGDEQTLPVAGDVKVVKGKFNRETKTVEAGDPIEDGIKGKMFTNIGEKGVMAFIVTDDDNKKITEIRILKGGKRKKKDQ